MTDQDQEEKNDEEFISLMTIHMAKGLEFQVVFIVGVEEDLFPSQMMISSREDLEEERRLFYVAITRTKIKLFLTFAKLRKGNIQKNIQSPSRFLIEIPKSYLKKKIKKLF